MKILITAGGGGHFAPALSVIEELPKNYEVLIVGRKYALEGDSALSLEYQTAKSLNIPFYALTTGRLQRAFTRYTLVSLLKLPYGFFEGIRVVKSFRPDVILCFGGYISLPVVIAGYLLRVPIVVHEQTQGAGLANKIASFFAEKVCISWESSRAFFPKEKIVLTGNPIKKFPISNFQFPISNEKLPIIYITGGSLGAHAINLLVEGCIEKLLKNFILIHQTGDAKQYGDYNRLSILKNSLSGDVKERYILTKFIPPNDVGAIMQKADLVIGRAGINTVTELLSFGKPSLLIPLPVSQKQEQVKNAQFLASVGIGEVVLQNDLTSETFYEKIISMIKHIETYKKHKPVAMALIYKDAGKRIIDVVQKAN